jgi:hypothetical protein
VKSGPLDFTPKAGIRHSLCAELCAGVSHVENRTWSMGVKRPVNVYRVGTLKNRPLDEAPRPKVNNLESEI